ncbi:MAG TPA: CPBP family intramembrane glutamic endopeptidase, partial [Sedimentisphaerales bacterium]|nr:CPBP family intramembrane glutamic endopeptidase [Sedimentisphaerales bacterium]
TRKKWRVRIADMLPMVGECAFWSIPLVAMGLLLSRPIALPIPAAASVLVEGAAAGDASLPNSLAGQIVTGIGAGIYEEFVFRLVLIVLLMILFQNLLGIQHTASVIASVLISAALFSAYHHVDILPIETGLRAADPFTWPKFIFRAAAGVYFAILFAFRGFGITAGTHAFYNIIVALMKTDLFASGS